MPKNSDYITAFKTYLLTEQRVSKNTYQAYATDIDQLMLFMENNQIAVDAVTNKDLSKYIHYLHEQKISARSIARKIATIKSFYKYIAATKGVEDIAKRLIIPKVGTFLPHYLTEDEIIKLLSVAANSSEPIEQRNHLVISLLYATGMRISELASLKLSDIRLGESLILVMGKGAKERMIPVPVQINTLLSDYIKGPYQFLIKHIPTNGSEPLFPTTYQQKLKSISRQALWYIVKDLCKRAGIKSTTSPHQLRHSLATHLLSNGADLRSLQILLGHETIATVQIYTHIEKSQMRVVYDKKHPRS